MAPADRSSDRPRVGNPNENNPIGEGRENGRRDQPSTAKRTKAVARDWAGRLRWVEMFNTRVKEPRRRRALEYLPRSGAAKERPALHLVGKLRSEGPSSTPWTRAGLLRRKVDARGMAEDRRCRNRRCKRCCRYQHRQHDSFHDQCHTPLLTIASIYRTHFYHRPTRPSFPTIFARSFGFTGFLNYHSSPSQASQPVRPLSLGSCKPHGGGFQDIIRCKNTVHNRRISSDNGITPFTLLAGGVRLRFVAPTRVGGGPGREKHCGNHRDCAQNMIFPLAHGSESR
jgi:hypothetical protein